jgi:hypothetical protein
MCGLQPPETVGTRGLAKVRLGRLTSWRVNARTGRRTSMTCPGIHSPRSARGSRFVVEAHPGVMFDVTDESNTVATGFDAGMWLGR